MLSVRLSFGSNSVKTMNNRGNRPLKEWWKQRNTAIFLAPFIIRQKRVCTNVKQIFVGQSLQLKIIRNKSSSCRHKFSFYQNTELLRNIHFNKLIHCPLYRIVDCLRAQGNFSASENHYATWSVNWILIFFLFSIRFSSSTKSTS